MNAEELRALQAPLKERYRAEPATAVVTLRAEGKLGEDVTCRVDTGRSLVEAGLHPATGGSGAAACSGDMLLEALVACAGVTLRAVATALGIEISHFARHDTRYADEPHDNNRPTGERLSRCQAPKAIAKCD